MTIFMQLLVEMWGQFLFQHLVTLLTYFVWPKKNIFKACQSTYLYLLSFNFVFKSLTPWCWCYKTSLTFKPVWVHHGSDKKLSDYCASFIQYIFVAITFLILNKIVHVTLFCCFYSPHTTTYYLQIWLVWTSLSKTIVDNYHCILTP